MYLAQHGMELVYGGSNAGLMGELAESALESGGRVVGVIPRVLQRREPPHHHLAKLYHVESMHDRKKLMYDLSDAFLTLPGGLGTLDELCEVLTWGQLGLHAKPVVIWNIEGFFDGLLAHFDRCIKDGFLLQKHRQLIVTDESLDVLFEQLRNFKAPELYPWINEDQR